MNIVHHFGGGVYSKEAHIPQGLAMAQHMHKHDHLSILASGIAVVTVDGVSSRITGPACLMIAAGKSHTVAAVTDLVWFCIHATDETDPDKVDHTLIKED